jgi:hypothetical protein
MAQKLDRTGEVHYNGRGQRIVIVKYHNNKRVEVYFPDTQELRTVTYLRLRQGRVSSDKRTATHVVSPHDIALRYGIDICQDRVFRPKHEPTKLRDEDNYVPQTSLADIIEQVCDGDCDDIAEQERYPRFNAVSASLGLILLIFCTVLGVALFKLFELLAR